MNDVTISREALSAYLYDVGALEVAKQQAIEKQKSSQYHLERNDAVIENLKEPSQPSYRELDSFGIQVRTNIIIVIIAGIIGFIGCFILAIPLKWFGIIWGMKHYLIAAGVLALLALLFCLAGGDTNKLIKEENDKLKTQYESRNNTPGHRYSRVNQISYGSLLHYLQTWKVRIGPCYFSGFAA